MINLKIREKRKMLGVSKGYDIVLSKRKFLKRYSGFFCGGRWVSNGKSFFVEKVINGRTVIAESISKKKVIIHIKDKEKGEL